MKPMLIAAAFLASTGAQPAPASIEGYWKNPVGSAIIAIERCGNAECGKVVWASARGQREVAKTVSNVVGTTVLTNLQPSGKRWAGNLFIPDDNLHVLARLQLITHRELRLTGCAVLGLICRTQVWTRADRPLPASE
jgi:uncharacterized protein (DUF2147 family)